MKHLRKSFLTLLALTLFGGAGAWAQQGPTNVTQFTTDLIASWQEVGEDVTLADLQALGFVAVDASVAQAWTGVPQNEYANLIYGFDGGECHYIQFDDSGDASNPSYSSYTKGYIYYMVSDGYKFFYTGAPNPVPAEIKLTPDATGKVWTLAETPDYDLDLNVVYYGQYTLDSIPTTWQVLVNGEAATVTPYTEGNTTLGHLTINETDNVELIPPADVKPNVKNVTLTEVSVSPFASVTTEDIGKIIGADGNIYDNADAATAAGTTASAIIAYVGTAGSVDESSSTYKGLAIALTDANSGDACQWYTANSGTCVSQTNANATAITYMDGIASTNTLTSDGHTHAAADAARNYSTARPSDVSAWFLPSMGQWNLIVQGLATKQAGSTVSTNLTGSTNDTYKADNLNTVITAAGGTGFQSNRYQSSTEYGTNRVWNMAFNGGNQQGGFKSNDYYVRAVFAF